MYTVQSMQMIFVLAQKISKMQGVSYLAYFCTILHYFVH